MRVLSHPNPKAEKSPIMGNFFTQFAAPFKDLGRHVFTITSDDYSCNKRKGAVAWEDLGEAENWIKALIEILEDKWNDPEIMRLKSNTAVEILDRAGYGPIKQVKVEQASISTQLTREELEAFRKRGIEAVRESGIVIKGYDNV